MTQLTIRGIDEQLHDYIVQEAQRRGQSVDHYVISVLRDVVENTSALLNREYSDLDHLAGEWTKDQADEFETHLRNQRQIDPALWT